VSLGQRNGSPRPFCLYSVSKMFYELRNASLDILSAVILRPNFLAEQELINIALEFTEEISCDSHRKVVAVRHCSLFYVQRWNFLIMKQCCGFLQIDMIPRKHFALSCHLCNEATAVYLSSKIRRWNPSCHAFPEFSVRRAPLVKEEIRRNCDGTE
jgi:hypothetical protein